MIDPQTVNRRGLDTQARRICVESCGVLYGQKTMLPELDSLEELGGTDIATGKRCLVTVDRKNPPRVVCSDQMVSAIGDAVLSAPDPVGRAVGFFPLTVWADKIETPGGEIPFIVRNVEDFFIPGVPDLICLGDDDLALDRQVPLNVLASRPREPLRLDIDRERIPDLHTVPRRLVDEGVKSDLAEAL